MSSNNDNNHELLLIIIIIISCCAGYEKAGKAVGMTGNMAAGAMFGAVGGPPGVVLGAIGGFALWGVGEVTGGLV